MELFYFALAAIAGGIGSGLLGFIESKTKWDVTKFLPNAIRSVIAGAGIAVSYSFVDMGLWAGIITAFLIGAGVDVLGHRIAGSTGK